MLNKTKFYISVILLLIGVGLAPTGFFLNGYLRDQVRIQVPDVLLDIREEVIPEIEAQFLGVGITEVLRGLKEQETDDIEEEIVKILSIPSVLLYLKNLSIPLFLARLNGSITSTLISESINTVYDDIHARIKGSLSAKLINATLEQVIDANSTTRTFAREVFFNNYTFQDDYAASIVLYNYSSIEGISEHATGGLNKLNYTAIAQKRLLNGFNSYPGLTTDLENGTGVLDFMEFYDNATTDPPTNVTMRDTYNSTWEQLTFIAGYISNYLWNSVIADIYTANYTMTSPQYALYRAKELFFNDGSWSTTTKGITNISGISEFGGSSNLSYTITAQNRILNGFQANPGILDELSLGTGVLDFLSFYAETSGNATMQLPYNATFYQLKNISSYLIQYMFDIKVTDQLASEGLTLGTAGLRDFYMQWANGTYFTDGIFLRDLSEELGEMLKASLAARLILNTGDPLGIINTVVAENDTTTEFATDIFFNNYNFSDNYSVSLLGVSEYISGFANYSLNFTASTQMRILYGYQEAPGILEEIESGLGMINWLDFFQYAYQDLGNNRTLMESTYNATWDDHLLPMGQYLQNYLINQKAGASPQTGLEVGIPTSSLITLNDSMSLWDPKNSLGFVNDTGILKWVEAYGDARSIARGELNATYGFSDTQFTKLYNWLFSTVQDILVPIIFILQSPLGIRLTTHLYAEILFLEQWANATVVPAGLDLGGGLKGLEVGIPEASNISYSIANALFNTKNSSSFIHKVGLLKWIDAEGGIPVVRTELITTFNLSTDQLDMILNWLFSEFKVNIVPNIAFNLTGYTMTDLAGFEFYRQWANGSLFTGGIDPGPALGLPSLQGWELGIPNASGIEFEVAMYLWDDENPMSLISPTGCAKWFKAMSVESTYNYLKDKSRYEVIINDIPRVYKYKFNDYQMQAIFNWLLKIREEFALPLSQEKLNLPVNAYEMGNILFMGFALSGIGLAAIGAFSAILIKISKRR